MDNIYAQTNDGRWFELVVKEIPDLPQFLKKLSWPSAPEGVENKNGWIFSLGAWWLPTQWNINGDENKESHYIKSSEIVRISKDRPASLKF